MSYVDMDVHVSPDAFSKAKDQALEQLGCLDRLLIRVSARVDLDEVLHLAGVDQLLEALENHPPAEVPMIGDIEACFAAVASGDIRTAQALLPRLFNRVACSEAAERGITAGRARRAA
jgi:hypothetical protein